MSSLTSVYGTEAAAACAHANLRIVPEADILKAINARGLLAQKAAIEVPVMHAKEVERRRPEFEEQRYELISRHLADVEPILAAVATGPVRSCTFVNEVAAAAALS